MRYSPITERVQPTAMEQMKQPDASIQVVHKPTISRLALEAEHSPRKRSHLLLPAPGLGKPLVGSGVLRLAQQLRQLGDVGGDAPCLVAGEEMHCRAML